MRNRLTRIICLSSALAALVGCQTPHHTNVMVFGTNTKLGFDIGSDATGARPQVNLGYKRQEMVWMPLLANSTFEETPPTPATCGSDCRFVSKDGTDKIDTYSVLASFGAEFGGSSSAGGDQDASATGSGGLAQFFATGLAARHLADEGGADLVSIRGTDRKAIAQAIADYQLQESERIKAALNSVLGEERLKRIAEEVASDHAASELKVETILKYLTKDDNTLNEEHWEKLKATEGLSEPTQKILKKFNNLGSIKNYLNAQADLGQSDIIDKLHTSVGADSNG